MKDELFINEIKRYIYYIVIIQFIYLFSLIILSWANYSNYFPLDLKIVIYIAISSGFGGVLHCIRSFYYHVSDSEDFKSKWTLWYIFRPILSVIIGIFSYFMIKGGFLFLNSNYKSNDSHELMFYSGLAFIIGIHFSDVMDKLHQISKVIFNPNSHLAEKTNGKKRTND